MSTDEVLDRDATGQAAAVALGEVSAVELVEAAIARIEALDPQVGAIVHERFDRARAEAAGPLPDGPFRGVPFLLKDAVQHSEGDRYQHGTRFLRDHPLVSPADTGGMPSRVAAVDSSTLFRSAGCAGPKCQPDMG